MIFTKIYPDFSEMPKYIDHLNWFRDKHCPEFLFYVAYFLDRLKPNSFVVYAAPETGRALYPLAKYLAPHHVLLVEDFSMGDSETKASLNKAIEDLRHAIPRVELIADDFQKVWEELSGVDFLLLDGPPNTRNFNPFANSFIFMMHDMNQRLNADYPGDSLETLNVMLCDPCSVENRELLQRAVVDGRYRMDHDTFYSAEADSPYGPHCWLVGRKA